MTEDQIARRAKRMMDKLGAEYLSTGMSADHYQIRVRQIDDWAWMQNFAIRIARLGLLQGRWCARQGE